MLNDRQKITLCPHRGSAIMEETDSCEGFIVFTYMKDVLLCDVCKNTSKQTKRKHSSKLGRDISKNSSGISAPAINWRSFKRPILKTTVYLWEQKLIRPWVLTAVGESWVFLRFVRPGARSKKNKKYEILI